MKREQKKQLLKVFKADPRIKLVYLFGSQATGDTGPLSDYDFAFYADEKNKLKLGELKIHLMSEISGILKTDDVDMVCLNTAESPELKYAVISEGKLLLSKEPFQLLVEPRILNEYFDFRSSLRRYHLTKS